MSTIKKLINLETVYLIVMEESAPQRPGSSKQEWWLETVSRGTPGGRRTARASASRLCTVVLFRNSANTLIYNFYSLILKCFINNTYK